MALGFGPGLAVEACFWREPGELSIAPHLALTNVRGFLARSWRSGLRSQYHGVVDEDTMDFPGLELALENYPTTPWVFGLNLSDPEI